MSDRKNPTEGELIRLWNTLEALYATVQVLRSQVHEWMPEEDIEVELTPGDCEHPKENQINTTGVGGDQSSFYCTACDSTVYASGVN